MKKVRINFVLSALLFAGAGVLPCVAQENTAQINGNFPYAPQPPAPNSTTINPTDYQEDETTSSMGVCQLVVDSANAGLFAPVSATILSYPGYSTGSYTLTSPVLYDNTTVIGSSQLEGYQSGSTGGGFTVTQTIPNQYSSGGVAMGLGGLPAPWNNIGSGAYLLIPPTFAGGLPGPASASLLINTEIEMFDLVCYNLSCVSNDSRTPPPPPTPIDMVTAGPNAGLTSPPYNYPPGLFGGGWNPATDLRRWSIGMVQQDSTASGTAAESFFNINVQVNLPAVANSASASDFPSVPGYTGVPPGLLRLTNNWMSSPLVITNTNSASLPPSVVYIHGSTPAVDLYFVDNGPTWNAGDHFGYLTLAGHGVVTNTTGGCAPGSSSTGQEGGFTQTGVQAFLDTTVGPVGSPKPPMPILYPRSSSLFPTPNTTLNSLVNTVVTDGETNVLDATASYSGGSVIVQDVVLGVLPNPISLPASLNGVGTYSATGVPFSCQLILAGTTYPASGTVSVTMAVTNEGLANTLTYAVNPPPTTNYAIGVLSLSGTALWAGGTVYVRQDPTNASLGMRTLQQTSSGYNMSTYLNAVIDVSSDNKTYLTPGGSLLLQDSAPPPGRPTIHVQQQVTNIVLNWQGGGTLWSTTNLETPTWTQLTSSNTLSPYTIQITAGSQAQFFVFSKP